jgi:hypothetical protein
VGIVRRLLSKGNDKMGETFHSWSLPAVRTCPGRSSVCERWCYATHGRFLTGKSKELMQWRLKQAARKDFADRMVQEICRRGAIVVRIHVSGDFMTPAYTAKWLDIATRSVKTTFFAYTRSWRVSSIAPLLRALSQLDNVFLWYSADRETGHPQDVPERVRVAWMQTAADEPVQGDLVFQTRSLRRLALPLSVPVCPQETPAGKERGVNCANCTICWQ